VNVGVAVGGAMIAYVAVATELLVYPEATAIALTVVVTEIEIAALYRLDAAVGTLPSTV
jgi:hypothetical protein